MKIKLYRQNSPQNQDKESIFKSKQILNSHTDPKKCLLLFLKKFKLFMKCATDLTKKNKNKSQKQQLKEKRKMNFQQLKNVAIHTANPHPTVQTWEKFNKKQQSHCSFPIRSIEIQFVMLRQLKFSKISSKENTPKRNLNQPAELKYPKFQQTEHIIYYNNYCKWQNSVAHITFK